MLKFYNLFLLAILFGGCDTPELIRTPIIDIGTPTWNPQTQRYEVDGLLIDFQGYPVKSYGHFWRLKNEPILLAPDSTYFSPSTIGRADLEIHFSSSLRRIKGLSRYFVWGYLELESGEIILSKVDSIEITRFESALEMVRVEGGKKKLGGPDYNAQPIQEIQISSFNLGKYEVTQHLWNLIMRKSPSFHEGCTFCPVENISTGEISNFILELNRKTGRNFRLPTEAEWEYAARGGVLGNGYEFSGAENVDNIGWYRNNVPFIISQPVGMLQPNELGIYDMSGNIAELCLDNYDSTYYRDRILINPVGPLSQIGTSSGERRVQRGGDYNDLSDYLTVWKRASRGDGSFVDSGFRLAEIIE